MEVCYAGVCHCNDKRKRTCEHNALHLKLPTNPRGSGKQGVCHALCTSRFSVFGKGSSWKGHVHYEVCIQDMQESCPYVGCFKNTTPYVSSGSRSAPHVRVRYPSIQVIHARSRNYESFDFCTRQACLRQATQTLQKKYKLTQCVYGLLTCFCTSVCTLIWSRMAS